MVRKNRMVQQFKLIYLLCVIVLLGSCENDQTLKYKWTNLDLAHLDNSGYSPVITTADSLPKSVYGLRLFLYPVETSRTGRRFDVYESTVTNDNPVEAITISSNSVINTPTQTFAAGDPINTLFYVFNNSYKTAIPLNLSSLNGTAYYNENYADEPFPKYVDLLLMNPPTNVASHRFIVNIRLTQGQIFSDTASIIKLQ